VVLGHRSGTTLQRRGYHRNIAGDAEFFAALARNPRRHFPFREYLDPVLDIRGAEYSSHAARTRAFFCLLAARKPRYLENGGKIRLDGSVVSHQNRPAPASRVPVARMRARFSARTYNGLCNICFLVSQDNNAIGMRPPRSYLAEYRDAGRKQFNRVMKSHLIPVTKDSGVWEAGSSQLQEVPSAAASTHLHRIRKASRNPAVQEVMRASKKLIEVALPLKRSTRPRYARSPSGTAIRARCHLWWRGDR